MSSGKYKLPSELNDVMGEIAGGTNLLISGSAMSGKEELADAILKEGNEYEKGVVSISTDYSADEVIERLGGERYEKMGVIDCVSQGKEGMGDEFGCEVELVGTPDDLTGIGIKVAEMFESLSDEEVEHSRVYLNSVSTVLMYSSLKTVFRFLHVLTGRIRSIDGIGIFVIDSDMHEEKEYSTLKPLFDDIIKVRRDGDVTEIKVEGIDTWSEWKTVSLD